MKRAFKSMGIYSIGILCGFLFSGFGEHSHYYIVGILIILMTLSIKNIHLGRGRIEHIGTIACLLVLSYVFVPIIITTLSYIFVPEQLYRNALLIFVFMPPSITTVTLTYLLHGDTKLGLLAEFASFGLTIILLPILSMFLFSSAVAPTGLLKVLVLVMIVPLFLSKGVQIVEAKTKRLPNNITKLCIDVTLATLFFVIISSNADKIISEPTLILRFASLFLIGQFGVAFIISRIVKNRINKAADVLYVLFGSFKNGSGALAVTALLFGIEATLPLAIHAMLAPFFVVYTEQLFADRMD